MSQLIKIIAIIVFFLLLSPIISIAAFVVPLIILCQNGGIERFDEKMNKIVNDRLKY